MTMFRVVPFLIALTAIAALAPAGNAQLAAGAPLSSSKAVSRSSDTPSPSVGGTPAQLNLTYTRPREKAKLHSYLFDAFGPYPIAGAVVFGALNQASKTPPEWGQGMGAYGERVGSVFGIELVTTTTRYALAEALREDTLYYRCECHGIVHRLGHALISTVTARVGDDGHRRLSFPAIVSPYAGSMTAVYGWYPSRYGVKDGFRMGNYSLLAFAASNILQEFIYGGPHTMFRHLHTPGTAAAPEPASTPNP